MNAPAPDTDALIAEARALHRPVEEEAERWPDDDLQPPVLRECTVTIQVCSECGYDHDHERAVYRGWPCPTSRLIAALADALEAEQARSEDRYKRGWSDGYGEANREWQTSR